MGAADAKIVAVAAVSRAVWLLIAAVADWSLRDYDTSAHLNDRPCGVDHEHTVASRVILLADVWDTVYFERISRCGYEFEQYLAFFPGLPLILSWFSHDVTTAVITGLVVTTLSFCLSAVMMYRCVTGES